MGDNSTLSRQSMKTSSTVDLSVKIEYDTMYLPQDAALVLYEWIKLVYM